MGSVLGNEVLDEPFPRAKDGKAIKEMFNQMVMQGLLRWEMVVVGMGILVFYLRS